MTFHDAMQLWLAARVLEFGVFVAAALVLIVGFLLWELIEKLIR